MIHSEVPPRIAPSLAASPQILDLTHSGAEADVWMYLGALLALGSVEPLACWSNTRDLIDHCGGQDALDALDLIHELQTRPDLENTPKPVGSNSSAVLERLKSAAELWVAQSQPARMFDVLNFLGNAERVQSELRGRLFYHWSQNPDNRAALVREHAKSPIEEALGIELVRRGCMVVPPNDVGRVSRFVTDTTIPAVLSMQCSVGKYRADFFVTVPGSEGGFVLECDGHEFHEKTKEQAARDKQRDRWFLSRGWPTMRFTGSEIYNRVERCANEVMMQVASVPMG